MRGMQQSLKVALSVAAVATGRRRPLGRDRRLLRRPGRHDPDARRRHPAHAAADRGRGDARAQLRRQLVLIALVLGVLGWAVVSRVVRGVVLSLREKEFVEAARGARRRRPCASSFRHLLPNAIGAIIVNATLNIAAGDPGRDGAVVPRASACRRRTRRSACSSTRPDGASTPGRGCSTCPASCSSS